MVVVIRAFAGVLVSPARVPSEGRIAPRKATSVLADLHDVSDVPSLCWPESRTKVFEHMTAGITRK